MNTDCRYNCPLPPRAAGGPGHAVWPSLLWRRANRRYHGWQWPTYSLSQVENLVEIRSFVREEATALGATEEAICDLELADGEAACNSIALG